MYRLEKFGTHIHFSIIVLIFSTHFISSQTNTYARVFYSNTSSAQSTEILESSDRGFIISGVKDNEGMLMKIDSFGNIKWSRKLGNSTNERFTCLLKTNDSTYLAAGKYLSPNSNLDILVTQFNDNGDTLWNRCYDLGYQEEAMSVSTSPDGGFIIAAVLLMTSAPNNQIGIVKLDANGQLQWAKKLSCGTNADIPYCIRATADTNYYLSGYTENYPPFDADGFLLKMNASGNIMWCKKYQVGNTWSQFRDFEIKGSCIYGILDTGDPTVVFLKTDMNGNVLHHKVYHNTTNNTILNEQVTKINATHDNMFILSTMQDILKVDTLGNPSWNQFFIMYLNNTIETSDHGFLVCGNGPVLGVTNNTGNLNPHIGIIKTDSLGNGPLCVLQNSSVFAGQNTITAIPINFNAAGNGTASHCSPVIDTAALQFNNGCVDFYGGFAELNPMRPLHIFPNPSNDQLHISIPSELQSQSLDIEITDFTGQVLIIKNSTAIEELQIDIESLSPGWYYISIKNSSKQLSCPFTICR